MHAKPVKIYVLLDTLPSKLVGETKMVKTYKVITARKQEDIEDKINQLAVDGWEVDKFGSATAEWNRFWALMVKEK